MDVAPGVNDAAPALGPLGTEIAQRPDDVAGGRQVALPPHAGQPEIGDPEAMISVDQEVRGLDVAVQDVVAMGVVERLGRLTGQLRRLARREAVPRPLAEVADHLGEVRALDQTHRQVQHAALVAVGDDGNDVRVLEARRWPGPRSRTVAVAGGRAATTRPAP